ncbi:hypothetical protein ANN_22443 [Periplaneta americana]|uniref:Uncharacterized protein n=1 Tax=Periplaneta americana TaxID=6978 RepID=A0ABQ8S8L3_PERAM|nr:hypothetical protein ANN_22443 [Periplaneta americana]
MNVISSQKTYLLKKESNHKKPVEEAGKHYDMKETDKIRSKLPMSCERVPVIDLQKCLPTPLLNNSQSVCLRNLWTFNLTVVDVTIQESHCFIWDETLVGMGGNEISSFAERAAK